MPLTQGLRREQRHDRPRSQSPEDQDFAECGMDDADQGHQHAGGQKLHLHRRPPRITPCRYERAFIDRGSGAVVALSSRAGRLYDAAQPAFISPGPG
ncbi:hypothetical protein [Bosea sp. LjRoot237]|uniref:hypothetical protein n=1 Tax=Bosea sp. LjRoot237 TaxID=3342292 RepID=UPI003ECDDB8A